MRYISPREIRFIDNNWSLSFLIWRINLGKLKCSLRLPYKQDSQRDTQKKRDEFMKISDQKNMTKIEENPILEANSTAES